MMSSEGMTMLVKLSTPDCTEVLINPDQVQAVFKVTEKRSNIQFANSDRHMAVSEGIDVLNELFNTKPASTRARKTT
jgi:hypothetical protein